MHPCYTHGPLFVVRGRQQGGGGGGRGSRGGEEEEAAAGGGGGRHPAARSRLRLEPIPVTFWKDRVARDLTCQQLLQGACRPSAENISQKLQFCGICDNGGLWPLGVECFLC
jgi:hypothetical protein